jgi:hypothetical protein
MTCAVKTIAKSMKLLAVLGNHLKNDSYHCRKLLIDWKQKSSGEQHPEAAVEFHIQRTNPNVNKEFN